MHNITILAKHAGSSGHAAQQNVILHKVYCCHIEPFARDIFV
jgi:hypothetical protein